MELRNDIQNTQAKLNRKKNCAAAETATQLKKLGKINYFTD